MENEVKEPAPKYNYVSSEEYLERERISITKHEYYRGELYAMSGASPEHNDIAYNINRLIAPFLHGKGCKLYGSDFRIHIPENLLFTYPDFSIVCGNAETSDANTDNLTNPVAIIEILSASTKNYDRGTKFNLYRNIKTLKEYLLIDSTAISVELFVRREDDSWNLTEFKQLSDSIIISIIGLRLSLKDIYDDVSFRNKIFSPENEVKEPEPKYNYVSQEAYLFIERTSEQKHEYFKGEVFAMSGASLQHNLIFHNVYGPLYVFLKGKNCKPFGSDFRIHIPENTLYTYPDISIICGEPETTDKWRDNFTNPNVIIEILSPSSKDYDRGTKFNLYRNIKTLKEYLLIDSTAISVELFARGKDNSWNLTEFKQLSQNVTISIIGLALSLKAIYNEVSFSQ